ncbi:MAG TPA: ATP-binding protein [Egibacteraceae bacterium]|nr:ATP-binding protein [Egibacteraceae bacterium]
MLRRSLLLLPLVAAGAALLGVALDATPVRAVLLAAAGGLVAAAALARAGERRVRRVADEVERLAEGRDPQPVAAAGSPQWRRLLDAVNAVAGSLRQRLDELAEQRARVERLLDGLPTAVLVFTDQGMAYANPAASRLFEAGRSQGRSPMQVLAVEALAAAVTEAAETNRSVEVEVERDDRQLLARASVTAEGEVTLVVTDLTDIRRVQAIRRDFVTNASHELKTPVAAIRALAESLSLAVEHDPPRGRRMIERLQQEAARLAWLVRDLLDLARLEETATRRERQRVDLAEIVAGEVERIGRLAEQRRVAVRCHAERSVPVIAVPEDLRLIAGNLLENAVQYNRDGGSVRVLVRRRDGQVLLEVTDTGIGIPEADRDRVFERFYRVDKGRSRAAGGTGLGLSLVRHAAQRHGGDVTVRSVLGEGSTFQVILPVEGTPRQQR